MIDPDVRVLMWQTSDFILAVIAGWYMAKAWRLSQLLRRSSEQVDELMKVCEGWKETCDKWKTAYDDQNRRVHVGHSR